MRKKFIPLILFIPIVAWALSTGESKEKIEDIKNKISSIPDSLFTDIKKEDLLKDEVYIKLARDGWSQSEIKSIFDDYIKQNRKQVRGSLEYGRYAKQWLPTYGYTPGADTIYQFVDTGYSKKMMQSIKAFSLRSEGNDFDNYYLSENYSPQPRMEGKRQPGVFRPAKPKPSSGRIHWIQVHPTDPDKIMVIPDGSGICRTDDGGKHWELITDRIPNRYHRNTATHSAIPVDPDNWDHLFAFMSNGNPVYETFDGGKTWTQVPGATHKGFKRGHAFKDSQGTLKFIGAIQKSGNNYWNSELWISEDKGVNWTQILVPDELAEYRPETNVKGAWFQEMAFHPTNRDLIYLPTSRAIFYFDNGARPETDENGNKKYVLKKLHFKVYNTDSTEVRSEGYNFPFEGTTQAFLNVNPNNPLEMWFATGSRGVKFGDYSALYRSRDGGKTWITLQEPRSNIGSGRLFGNECPWGWLGGFGVNYQDSRYLYGCSMSSGISTDGGINFSDYAWGHRLKSLQDDGLYYPVTNSRHNADNHCIVSHASGRVYRGSDGGMLIKDKDINNHEWTNIGGDMGQMLFYCIRVNEFGDQMMLGNTQDIDVQTYREGRWGGWRGYEGSTAFINPYSNMGYFPSGGGGIDGLDYGSWVSYDVKADVCTGNWYIKQKDVMFIIEDFGKKSRRLQIVGMDGSTHNVNSYALSRNAKEDGASTLWVRTGGSWFRYSQDNGNTFTSAFQVSGLTNVQTFEADPNDWTKLYIIGKSGNDSKVYLCDMEKKTIIKDLTYDLPTNLGCNQFLLHEGSGDLYFYNSNTGVFLLENGSTNWKFWMKGYNAAKSGSIVINNTTQEMVLHDYGRGIYVADLQNPSDRYFDNGFSLKVLSNHNGKMTLGINTAWTIPFYYDYTWTVNGTDVNNPYQYLTRELKKGDRVQLKLKLRQSPDVTTLSEEYVIKSEDVRQKKTNYAPNAFRALYSDGSGRVDLGYVDLFYKDFTIDLWVCPESANGVILSNGQKEQTRGGRGWWLGMENGVLKFNYAPTNRFTLPTYETWSDQEKTLQAGALPIGKWSHVAVTQQRNGSISIYVNGVKKVSEARILPQHSLNNSMYLSLFADGYEQAALTGAVDELKIWNYAMTDNDVKLAISSHITSNADGLVYYNDFDKLKLEDNKEFFSQATPKTRILARTSSCAATATVKAEKIAYGNIDSEGWIGDSNSKMIAIQPTTEGALSGTDLYVYGFRHNFLEDTLSNLDYSYYKTAPVGYVVRNFGNTPSQQKVKVTFQMEDVVANRRYRLYAAPIDQPSSYWEELALLTAGDHNELSAEGIDFQKLIDQKLIITWLEEGIEIVPDEGSSLQNGAVTVLDDDLTEISFTAYLRGGDEPNRECRLQSSSELVRFDGPIHFAKGIAIGKKTIDTHKLGGYGSKETVQISGQEVPVVPFTFHIIDKRVPKVVGTSLQIDWGGLYLGDANTFQSLNLSNEMTFMSWIRIEDAAVLKGLTGLMMFRSNSGATGIHLQDGNIRCHWNEEGWSWSTATNLTITPDDLGKWMHIAMVARPTGIDFYLNGRKHTISRTINPTRISSELMLGMARTGEKRFKGCFDQVMVWNRSLDQEEVLHHMHNVVILNEDKLVAYANMDIPSETRSPLELVHGTPIRTNGTVNKNVPSEIPYKPVSTSAERIKATFNGQALEYRLNIFNQLPYNYAYEARTVDIPLAKESFTYIPNEYVSYEAEDMIQLEFSSEAAVAGDGLKLAIRPMGSLLPFVDSYESTVNEEGKAIFTIPALKLQTAVEMIVFVTTSTSDRPNKVKFSLYDVKKRPANAFILQEGEDELTVHISLLAGDYAKKVPVYIKESTYVQTETDSVDFTKDEITLKLKLDLNNLNSLAWNPVTVNLVGVTSEPLEMNVAFEPKVRLSLDQNDQTGINATSPVVGLPIKVELVEGVFDEGVQMEVISDVPSIMNGTAGDLFTNRTVEFNGLEFAHVANKADDGWNLVGNPYLSSINVTKTQNYSANNVSRYIYHYDNITRNYVISDMLTFEAEKQINPFTSFFVQTLDANASFAVNEQAKSKTLNRKVFSYDVASEQMALILQLCSEGNAMDEVKLMWENGASENFVVNEDAQKMWSLSSDAIQIYSHDLAYKAMAINILPVQTSEVPVAVNMGKTGKFTIKVKTLNGFNEGDKLELVDKITNQVTTLKEGSTYDFQISEKGKSSRFAVRVKRTTTGIAQPNAGYPITVDNGTCIISGLQGNADILVYDMAGRTIATEKTSDAVYSIRLNNGNYLIRIKENGKEYVTKIAVK